MKKIVENLIEALDDPKHSAETRELIRKLLHQQAKHERDLLKKINDALDQINHDLPI